MDVSFRLHKSRSSNDQRLVYLQHVDTINTILDTVLGALRRLGDRLPDDVRSFIVHFRVLYQVFVIAVGYLMGSLFVGDFTPASFWLQYLNVSILLFGTATVYNSWQDRDEGPVGGLKNPPKMQPWMRRVALWMQFGGLLLAHYAGIEFTYIYLACMVLLWMYSTRRIRWKALPIRSLVVVAFGAGAGSFWMGYYAAGGATFSFAVIIAGIGVAMIYLSMYTISQLGKMRLNAARGDRTFAIEMGVKGTKRFHTNSFRIGVALVGLPLVVFSWPVGLVFIALGIGLMYYAKPMVADLAGDTSDMPAINRLKYTVSLSFAVFALIVMIVLHAILA